MAIYYLNFKVFGRDRGSRGSVSTSAAAYRSGERIRDERTGAVYDHSKRRDVMHKEILLPSQYERAGVEIEWARDRSLLWNAAEQAEKQRNSRVAREYVVALPHELQAQQRLELAQSFARTISDRYGNAVDLAVHAPRTDPRNFHAHLLTTTRQITPYGLGEKTTIEWNGARRHEQGLPRYEQEYRNVRETWAELANYALREAGLEQRISHVRDPDAMPRQSDKIWLPRIAYEIEKRGEHSYVGDLVRRRVQERRQERMQEWLRGKEPERQPEQALRKDQGQQRRKERQHEWQPGQQQEQQGDLRKDQQQELRKDWRLELPGEQRQEPQREGRKDPLRDQPQERRQELQRDTQKDSGLELSGKQRRESQREGRKDSLKDQRQERTPGQHQEQRAEQQERSVPEKARAPTREERAAAAVQEWRAWREQMKQGREAASQENARDHARAQDRGHDDDHGL